MLSLGILESLVLEVYILFRSPYGICPSIGGGGALPPDMSDAKNHILLFTIFNPMYPITVVSY